MLTEPQLQPLRMSWWLRLQKADKRMNGLLKTKAEKAKRQKNVQQMQAAHVSDSEEDDAADRQQMEIANQQAKELQADEGDPEPTVLQQALFTAQVSYPEATSLFQGYRNDPFQAHRVKNMAVAATVFVDFGSVVIALDRMLNSCSL